MAISGVGTVYSYNYNLASKRISGANGQNDEFVQYCNGELNGEDSADLFTVDEDIVYPFDLSLTVADGLYRFTRSHCGERGDFYRLLRWKRRGAQQEAQVKPRARGRVERPSESSAACGL